MGLLTSEWLRFRSRKLIRWLLALSMGGVALTVVIATAASRPGSGDELALGDLPEYLQAAGVIGILLGLVGGASAVGASWQAGTVTTILTWEPRRIRWYLSRLVVVGVGMFLVTVVVMALFGAGIGVGAALKGSTATDPGWLRDVVTTGLRLAGLAVAGSLVGATVAMIGRNTAAALGAVFVYLIILESVVGGFRPGLSPYLLVNNIAVVISGESIMLDVRGSSIMLSPARGVLTIGAYLAVLVVVSAILLRRRDVQ